MEAINVYVPVHNRVIVESPRFKTYPFMRGSNEKGVSDVYVNVYEY